MATGNVVFGDRGSEAFPLRSLRAADTHWRSQGRGSAAFFVEAGGRGPSEKGESMERKAIFPNMPPPPFGVIFLGTEQFSQHGELVFGVSESPRRERSFGNTRARTPRTRRFRPRFHRSARNHSQSGSLQSIRDRLLDHVQPETSSRQRQIRLIRQGS